MAKAAKGDSIDLSDTILTTSTGKVTTPATSNTDGTQAPPASKPVYDITKRSMTGSAMVKAGWTQTPKQEENKPTVYIWDNGNGKVFESPTLGCPPQEACEFFEESN